MNRNPPPQPTVKIWDKKLYYYEGKTYDQEKAKRFCELLKNLGYDGKLHVDAYVAPVRKKGKTTLRVTRIEYHIYCHPYYKGIRVKQFLKKLFGKWKIF